MVGLISQSGRRPEACPQQVSNREYLRLLMSLVLGKEAECDCGGPGASFSVATVSELGVRQACAVRILCRIRGQHGHAFKEQSYFEISL